MAVNKIMNQKAQEAKWQREDDARTLAMAQEINDDKKRKAAAIKEAKLIAKRDEKRIKAMKKVAGKTANKKRKTKSTKNTKKK